MGGRTVLVRGSSDDGGVRPVPHLQAVFPVWHLVLTQGDLHVAQLGCDKVQLILLNHNYIAFA